MVLQANELVSSISAGSQPDSFSKVIEDQFGAREGSKHLLARWDNPSLPPRLAPERLHQLSPDRQDCIRLYDIFKSHAGVVASGRAADAIKDQYAGMNMSWGWKEPLGTTREINPVKANDELLRELSRYSKFGIVNADPVMYTAAIAALDELRGMVAKEEIHGTEDEKFDLLGRLGKTRDGLVKVMLERISKDNRVADRVEREDSWDLRNEPPMPALQVYLDSAIPTLHRRKK